MTLNAAQTKLLDLPLDILYLIFPYLDVPDFVALTSTCKALHQPDLSQYARYWSSATRITFRVPNQPVVQNDGARWQKMYKRLLTQSKVYTWGNNEKGCLGHSQVTTAQLNAASPDMRRRLVMASRHVSWPTEMENAEDIGIIADMQCGGWSTTLLSSKGALYTVGTLDGLYFHQGGAAAVQRSHSEPEKLRYPSGFPHPSERYERSTAVRQFSAGRSHVLAVSDSGRLWSWQNIDHAAYNVKFLNIDLKEQAKEEELGYVQKVVAGWNKSSALINGAGIVLWDPLRREPGALESEEDAALVLESAVVPRTTYRRPGASGRTSHSGADSSEQDIGEVQSYIVLEHYILFNTHHGKIFAGKITWDNHEQSISSPFEIPLPPNTATVTSAEPQDTVPFATDVQGSFRSFAIFTRSGAVLTGDQAHLDSIMSRPEQVSSLSRIPALQKNNVISLAFGDYHFHALHASGHITSYGKEPQGCGALGLGGHGDPAARFRGLKHQGIGNDASLVPHAYSTGRRIWFEQEKRAWIIFLTSGGVDPEEARERMRMCRETSVQGEVSEWIEQEGRAWEQIYGGNDGAKDDDGLGAYFALTVTAAGWHSGALVLVNEDLAKDVAQKCRIAPPQPPKAEREVEEQGQDETSAGENGDQQPPGQRQPNSALISRALSTTIDWGRWFLGLPSSADYTPNVGPSTRMSARRDPNNPQAFVHPNNHGAAAGDGTPYAWANDHYPRLRLADGREMPGTAEFNEWRHGRPEWDLSYEG